MYHNSSTGPTFEALIVARVKTPGTEVGRGRRRRGPTQRPNPGLLKLLVNCFALRVFRQVMVEQVAILSACRRTARHASCHRHRDHASRLTSPLGPGQSRCCARRQPCAPPHVTSGSVLLKAVRTRTCDRAPRLTSSQARDNIRISSYIDIIKFLILRPVHLCMVRSAAVGLQALVPVRWWTNG
jgi:hypothetical protein